MIPKFCLFIVNSKIVAKFIEIESVSKLGLCVYMANIFEIEDFHCSIFDFFDFFRFVTKNEIFWKSFANLNNFHIRHRIVKIGTHRRNKTVQRIMSEIPKLMQLTWTPLIKIKMIFYVMFLAYVLFRILWKRAMICLNNNLFFVVVFFLLFLMGKSFLIFDRY